MNIHLHLNTDNAAFEDHGVGNEVARILKNAASMVADWPGANEFTYKLRDANGNTVGSIIAER